MAASPSKKKAATTGGCDVDVLSLFHERNGNYDVRAARHAHRVGWGTHDRHHTALGHYGTTVGCDAAIT